MAFKTRWECEYCGHVIWAATEPEDYDCPNSKDDMHNPCSEPDYSEDSDVMFDRLKELMSSEERKERYRIAYHMRGSTWEGVTAYMYRGELDKGQILMEEAKENSSKKTLLEVALIKEAEYMKT